ncbi:MAG: hypothetical protein AW10_00374 [Candidatus Accumulibacter appositus]|uniref:Uncharacterized protein n=1 Tax=Candidatus Accumulibacter appositus TaxID=1454003 RepID=A0A011NIH0_9PROT|nr:MAG: hypothetical protein AW10_00374 [Candidatus Accumulibacter appositus]
MVSNHAVACVEALIQVHRFDQAFRHRNAERGELVGQRPDNASVEGRLMQTVVEDVVLAHGPALVAQHQQEQLAQRPIVSGHDNDFAAAMREPDVMPTHASGPDMSKTGSPSITAASLSNFSQTMPACSATSKIVARSASVGIR